MNISLSQNGPRVNLAERRGEQGLRIRHETLSIFLTRAEALQVAHRIADLVTLIPDET
ncbi:hypothetical protein ACXVUM_12125 [Williamsia sp. SKLECPSW1]